MDFSQLRAEAERFAARHEQEIVSDIARLVAVKSVRGTPEPGAPFGPGPRAALREGLALAAERGLAAEDLEVMGRAFVPGTGTKTVGMIAHLDVVPEGSGWDTDPYLLTEREGWLLGRGVADDKGPAVLALWAAKFFADLPQRPRHGIEVLLGTAEETGMEDLSSYLASHPAPDFAFTPDAAFPVCNGEKGGFGGEFVSGPLDGVLRDFEGGLAANVVPDHAFAVVALPAEKLPAAEGITVTAVSGGARLEATGIAAHASAPEGSRSAIGMIASYLLENQLAAGKERAALELIRDLAISCDGALLGIAARDDVFTPLTIIGGQIRMEDGALIQNLDCRYPTSITGDEITERLSQRAAAAGMVLRGVRVNPPFYIAPDAPPILALRSTYHDLTGKSDAPFTMGGGTYARHLPCAVSFGVEEEGLEHPPFVGRIHGANEGFPRKKLLDGLVIFICALGRLMEIDL
ncbi:Sapep family Mn(2+)-dependent dipeptidase [Anaerofilum sp. BX8]|uniref:Sapep family Mn(2+)-dependent dipeptidase n=1 Tax=Anaerofilum hominis TaxID=2763016 RepID=A0A923I8V9_9FIRM|nr:Sapep family Mn(2+)-dependent dipeptidase [Anaerofilum hominis]MBC5580408.1 Sapep family Mn(2+)-dependent dipeptidase [Anaerofilum hominis]